MKKCLNCENIVPTRCTIDGKLRNLNNRKYCFDCSPFGQHNTKKVHLESASNPMRICRTCNREYQGGHQKHKDICDSCRVAEVRKLRKKELIDYKGGKCKICNYNKCQKALEFHHINPENKKFAIANTGITRIEILKEEADKCILVCSNCHVEIHDGSVDINKYI
jgi:hypothetical protein